MIIADLGIYKTRNGSIAVIFSIDSVEDWITPKANGGIVEENQNLWNVETGESLEGYKGHDLIELIYSFEDDLFYDKNFKAMGFRKNKESDSEFEKRILKEGGQ